MRNMFLKNDARAIMTFDYIKMIQKLKLFERKNSIINIGSFDLIEDDNFDLGMKLLTSLCGNVNEIDLTRYLQHGKISSKILWKELGFDEIVFIDSDGVHESLAYDFNKDIQDELGYYETFDIVTNFGTTEHIFNQYAVFNNIHKLCNKDGLMIHSLPIQGGYEHGFYNYHPNFFLALSNSNNYKIEYIGIRDEKLSEFNLVEIESSLIEPFLNNINAYDTVGIFVILRKIDDEKFKVPFQGRYEVHRKNTNSL